MATSDGNGRSWVSVAKFNLPVTKKDEAIDPTRFADALAEGVVGRLVRAHLVKGPREKGKITYGIQIENGSPLILHGLAVAGAKGQGEEKPGILYGFGVAPRRNLVLPATEESVKAMGLKQGIRVMAADLGGL